MDNINNTYDHNSPMKSHGGVRRCRDMELTTSGSSKRAKFNFRDHENVIQPENKFRGEFDVNSPEDIVSSTDSGTCDHLSSSQCLNNCLSLDLKVELRSGSEASISGDGSFSRQMSSSSEIYSDSNKTEAAATPEVTSSRNPEIGKYPTAAEIDEFFTVIEQKEQKRFSEKYNFDIVKDVPMNGRYQWVRLKP